MELKLSSEDKAIIDEYGLSDLKVVKSLSASLIAIWHDGSAGLSLVLGRSGKKFFQVALKAGATYALYRCELARLEPCRLANVLEKLREGRFSTREAGLEIGEGPDAVLFKLEA